MIVNITKSSYSQLGMNEAHFFDNSEYNKIGLSLQLGTKNWRHQVTFKTFQTFNTFLFWGKTTANLAYGSELFKCGSATLI